MVTQEEWKFMFNYHIDIWNLSLKFIFSLRRLGMRTGFKVCEVVYNPLKFTIQLQRVIIPLFCENIKPNSDTLKSAL